MYNEEFKKKIIEEEIKKGNLNKDSIPKFENAAEYEESIGKDLSDFTKEEILECYKSMKSPSLEYLMFVNSTFGKYCSVANNSNKSYCTLNNEDYFSCINRELADKQIVTRNEIINFIKTLENVSDRFLVLALFEGMKGKSHEDLFYAEPDQFHDGKAYLHSGKVIPVSEDLIKLAKVSGKEYRYICYSNSGREATRHFDPFDNRCLKRMYNAKLADNQVDETRMLIRVRSRLDRIKANSPGFEFISTKSLSESGRIHLIKKYMKEDGINDPITIIHRHKDIEEIYGVIPAYSRWNVKYSRFF